MAITPRNIEKATRAWTFYAGEPVEVVEVDGKLFGFGSELAVLRLYRRFEGKGDARFSPNLKKWYYTPVG